jgi:hypothetical protein
MQEQPNRIDLLRAVSSFVRDKAIPQLTGQAAFHARVAANVLDIVVRELELGPAAEAGELQRLRALLQDDGAQSLEQLNETLCDRIAAGEMTLDTPGLRAHLWEVTMNKLAIDQPGYASYRRMLEERAADQEKT